MYTWARNCLLSRNTNDKHSCLINTWQHSENSWLNLSRVKRCHHILCIVVVRTFKDSKNSTFTLLFFHKTDQSIYFISTSDKEIQQQLFELLYLLSYFKNNFFSLYWWRHFVLPTADWMLLYLLGNFVIVNIWIIIVHTYLQCYYDVLL